MSKLFVAPRYASIQPVNPDVAADPSVDRTGRAALWTCPRCGHRFVSSNIWHSCSRHSVDEHFIPAAPQVRAAFDRLVELYERCGPIVVIAQKTRIVFMVRARFGGCHVKRDRIATNVSLPRRVEHPRWTRIEQLGRWYLHHYDVDRRPTSTTPSCTRSSARATTRWASRAGWRAHSSRSADLRNADGVRRRAMTEAVPAGPRGQGDPDNPWGTFLNVLVEPLERFDVNELAAANERPWYNQTLSRVNDCVMRLGVIRGDYPWHRHDDEDELFYVVDGGLELDVHGRDPIALAPGQGTVVPRGVEHRPRAAERTIILMVEGAGVVPTGD